MNKVVLVLEGGLVQAIYSQRDDVEVAVLDRDVFDDLDPKLDLDNFVRPEVDPDLNVLAEWRERKAAFVATVTDDDGD